jgi:hypothetical protein
MKSCHNNHDIAEIEEEEEGKADGSEIMSNSQGQHSSEQSTLKQNANGSLHSKADSTQKRNRESRGEVDHCNQLL